MGEVLLKKKDINKQGGSVWIGREESELWRKYRERSKQERKDA